MSYKKKYSFVFAILSFVSIFAMGQDINDTSKTPFNCSGKIEDFKGQHIFTIVEKMPSYYGGDTAFMKLIQENLKLENSQDEFQTKIYLTVVIDTKGNMINRCLKNTYYPDKLTKNEESVLSALDRTEKWTPGEQNGKKVLVKIQMPIIFSVKE